MSSQTAATASLGHWINDHAKTSLFGAAIISLIASMISMASIYGDPMAHIKICLGAGGAPVATGNTLLLYGHCGWCYLALGMAIAALIVPGKPRKN